MAVLHGSWQAAHGDGHQRIVGGRPRHPSLVDTYLYWSPNGANRSGVYTMLTSSNHAFVVIASLGGRMGSRGAGRKEGG